MDTFFQNLNNLTVIQDICGKEMLAIDVFGLVIEYLRNHLLSRVESQDSKSMLQEDMIQWVLTVPAIWGEKAKQFMRNAAAKVRFYYLTSLKNNKLNTPKHNFLV